MVVGSPGGHRSHGGKAVPTSSAPKSTRFSSLARKRLHFFVGKGGVGKTTIAAAFALATAQQGKKTLLIEFDQAAPAAHVFALPASSPSASPQLVSPTLSVLTTTGQAALEEYLSRVLPAALLRTLVLQSQLYQYFVLAAPGLKELMAMGKVWYEAERKDEQTGRAVWDALIVDMPASGHSLQYLRMPQAAYATFGLGEVRRKAQQVLALFRNSEHSAVHIVSLPEVLAIEETVEIVQQIDEKLHLPLGALFVNQVRSLPVARPTLERLYADPKASKAERRAAEQVLGWAKYEAGLADSQIDTLQQLADLSLPIISLPHFFFDGFTLPGVETLSSCIQSALFKSEESEPLSV